ncbi:MAG: hypothetical protein RH860_00455 [Cytophagales bacterium]
MDAFTLIVEILIVGLLIALIVTLIKYPLDIIRGTLEMIRPELSNPRSWIFFPIWIIFYGLNKLFDWNIIEEVEDEGNKSEKRYPSKRNLKIDFSSGEKFLQMNAEQAKIDSSIQEFLEFSEGRYNREEFGFDDERSLMNCPKNISFYDFNILIQHCSNELKNGVFGIFVSPNLSYYAHQDKNTLHNLIGRTKEGTKFSIYTLDNLNKKIHLRINDGLKVRKFNLEGL